MTELLYLMDGQMCFTSEELLLESKWRQHTSQKTEVSEERLGNNFTSLDEEGSESGRNLSPGGVMGRSERS